MFWMNYLERIPMMVITCLMTSTWDHQVSCRRILRQNGKVNAIFDHLCNRKTDKFSGASRANAGFSS